MSPTLANNCSTAVTVTVVAPPDLVVVTIRWSTTTIRRRRTDLTLSATVRNAGGAEAGNTTLTYYRSTDSTISSIDTPEGTVTVSSLSAGAEQRSAVDQRDRAVCGWAPTTTGPAWAR